MAPTKTCHTCGKVFAKPDHDSAWRWRERKFCSLECRKKKSNDRTNNHRQQCARGVRLGLSADALHLANPARYAGPLTREVWTLASRELEDVRRTMEILRARRGHMGELPRHERRLAAVVARGWEVRV